MFADSFACGFHRFRARPFSVLNVLLRGRRKRMRRRLDRSFVCAAEVLEERTLLAGNVTAALSTDAFGDNHLTITPDAQDNSFAVVPTTDGDDIVVVGFDGTTVNSSGDRFVVVVPSGFISGNVVVNSRTGGNDVMVLGEIDVGGNIEVYGGNGKNDIALVSVDIGGDLRISTLDGNDRIYADGNASLGGSIAGSVLFNTGGGNDSVFLDSVDIHKDLKLSTSVGNDALLLDDVSVDRFLFAFTGGDDDDVVLNDVRNTTRTIIGTQSGDDQVAITGGATQFPIGSLAGGGTHIAGDAFDDRVGTNLTPRFFESTVVADTVIADVRVQEQAFADEVTEILAAPTANVDSIDVNEGGSVTFTAAGLIANDLPATLSGPFAVSIPGLAIGMNKVLTNGELRLNNDGSFTYTHDGSENFSDSFVYELDDGVGINRPAMGTVNITIIPVNDQPTLNPIANPDAILEDAGLQTINLSNITAGGGEVQTLTVTAVSDNPALIPNPTVTYTSPDTTGTLTYAPVPEQNGTAVITVTVMDDGGTANGGVDTTTETFTINVTAVNDAPSFTLLGDPPPINDNALQTVPAFARDISSGPPNESGQALTFNLSATITSGNLAFSTSPAIDEGTGDLTYAVAPNTSGTADVTVTLSDDGSNIPPNQNTSQPQTFKMDAVPGITIDNVTVDPEGDFPDVVLTLDVSGSMRSMFQGTPVGDVNGDDSENTRLDASLAGMIAFNQKLITDGFGSTADVGIVVFAGNRNNPPDQRAATQVDMNPRTPGAPAVMLSTTPTADLDNNGRPDVEDVLRTLTIGALGTGGVATNFERGLQLTIDTFSTLRTRPGSGTMILVSDGEANQEFGFRDEANTLRSMAVSMRAFGVGSDASLRDLQVIDPNATRFTTTDDLLRAFGDFDLNEAIFTVSLSLPSTSTVTVDFATADGSATAGGDYVATAGTVEFLPGTTTQTITVPIISDTLIEQRREDFFVNLTNPMNAVIIGGQGVGTIVDDDIPL